MSIRGTRAVVRLPQPPKGTKQDNWAHSKSKCVSLPRQPVFFNCVIVDQTAPQRNGSTWCTVKITTKCEMARKLDIVDQYFKVRGSMVFKTVPFAKLTKRNPKEFSLKIHPEINVPLFVGGMECSRLYRVVRQAMGNPFVEEPHLMKNGLHSDHLFVSQYVEIDVLGEFEDGLSKDGAAEIVVTCGDSELSRQLEKAFRYYHATSYFQLVEDADEELGYFQQRIRECENGEPLESTKDRTYWEKRVKAFKVFGKITGKYTPKTQSRSSRRSSVSTASFKPVREMKAPKKSSSNRRTAELASYVNTSYVVVKQGKSDDQKPKAARQEFEQKKASVHATLNCFVRKAVRTTERQVAKTMTLSLPKGTFVCVSEKNASLVTADRRNNARLDFKRMGFVVDNVTTCGKYTVQIFSGRDVQVPSKHVRELNDRELTLMETEKLRLSETLEGIYGEMVDGKQNIDWVHYFKRTQMLMTKLAYIGGAVGKFACGFTEILIRGLSIEKNDISWNGDNKHFVTQTGAPVNGIINMRNFQAATMDNLRTFLTNAIRSAGRVSVNLRSKMKPAEPKRRRRKAAVETADEEKFDILNLGRKTGFQPKPQAAKDQEETAETSSCYVFGVHPTQMRRVVDVRRNPQNPVEEGVFVSFYARVTDPVAEYFAARQFPFRGRVYDVEFDNKLSKFRKRNTAFASKLEPVAVPTITMPEPVVEVTPATFPELAPKPYEPASTPVEGFEAKDWTNSSYEANSVSSEPAAAPKPKSQRQRQRRKATKAEPKPQPEPIVEPVAEETVQTRKPPMKTTITKAVEPTPTVQPAFSLFSSPMPVDPSLAPFTSAAPAWAPPKAFRSPVLADVALPKVHDATALVAVEEMSSSSESPAPAAPVIERSVSAGVDKGEVVSKPAAVVKKFGLPLVAAMTVEQLAGLLEKSRTKKFQACAAMILEEGISGEDIATFDEDAYEIIQEVTGLSKVFTKKLFRELKSHDSALEKNTAGILSHDGHPW